MLQAMAITTQQKGHQLSEVQGQLQQAIVEGTQIEQHRQFLIQQCNTLLQSNTAAQNEHQQLVAELESFKAQSAQQNQRFQNDAAAYKQAMEAEIARLNNYVQHLLTEGRALEERHNALQAKATNHEQSFRKVQDQCSALKTERDGLIAQSVASQQARDDLSSALTEAKQREETHKNTQEEQSKNIQSLAQ